ncbi:MAG: zinc ribbon domain-containing protein [Anaerolineales bacterium]
MAIPTERIICPACNTAVYPDSRGGLRCVGCGAVLAEPFLFCPRCGCINTAGATTCTQCAEELTVPCPVCRQVNWSGAKRCSGCGRELDPLAHAFRPVSASFELRRQDLIENVSVLREKEERGSRARLETLRRADSRRMRRSAVLAERARLSERRIIIGVGIGIAVILIVIITAAVILH